MTKTETGIETRGSSLFWVTVFLPTIAWMLYLCTLWHKFRFSKFGKEDLMLALATTLLIIQTLTTYECIHYGFGKHASDLKPRELSSALQYFYIMQVVYKPLGGLVKLAFLCLYHRVFEVPKFQTLVKCFIVYIAIGSVAFTFATAFQCTPVSYNWNKHQRGHCIGKASFWYSHAAWHITSDIAIFIMPVPIISQLNMARSKKIGLAGVFTMGLFTCIASIVRMTTLFDSSRSNEPTWGSYYGMLWTQIDSCTSIISACLPILRKPFSDLVSKIGLTCTTTSESSCDLEDMPAPKPSNNSHMVWDEKNKKWFQEYRLPELYYESSSRRASLGGESVMAIMRTTDVEILRSSADGSGSVKTAPDLEQSDR